MIQSIKTFTLRAITATTAFFSSVAFAADQAVAGHPVAGGHPAHPQHAGFSMLAMPLIILAVFYFLAIRPQMKKQREHKSLLNEITIGDEVITSAGIIGKITKLREQYIVLNVSGGQELTFSRQAISQILPKGTIDGIG